MATKNIALIGIIAAILAAGQFPSAGATFADFYGTASIGANTSTNGAFVFVYVNGSSTAFGNTTVGYYAGTNSFYDNKYGFTVNAGEGANITFRVFDMNATHSFVRGEGNRSELNLSVTLLAEGAACTFAQSCGTATCTSGVCASNSTTTTTTPTGGGGGGGGGAGTPEPSEEPPSLGEEAEGGGGVQLLVEIITKLIEKILPQQTVVIEIEAGEISSGGGVPAEPRAVEEIVKIDTISITISETAGGGGGVKDVEVTVTKETEKPAAVPAIELAENEVAARYITINVANINEEDIAEEGGVVINFAAEKAWSTQENIDEKTVNLNRYTTGWEALPTTLVDQNEAFWFYEAVSPGFSYFVITATKKEACTPGALQCSGNILQQCNEAGVFVDLEVCEAGCSNNACNLPGEWYEEILGQPSTAVIVILLAVIVFMAGMGILHLKHKHHPQWPFSRKKRSVK